MENLVSIPYNILCGEDDEIRERQAIIITSDFRIDNWPYGIDVTVDADTYNIESEWINYGSVNTRGPAINAKVCIENYRSYGTTCKPPSENG